MLRFNITFSGRYPSRPPILTLLSDVFHPMITPTSTYTHITRDPSIGTVSAGDDDRLPPGGLSLRHAFPEWFAISSGSEVETSNTFRPPHIIDILQYLRIIFTVEEALDSVPVELAANNGAWHAWRSHRSKALGKNALRQSSGSDVSGSQSPPRQQPGGARRPGEWNWQGVWEDRVRKSISATNSEQALFVHDERSVVRAGARRNFAISYFLQINFRKQEPDEAAAAA